MPVIALADDISAALSVGNVLLQAQPGAGKSTALPLAILLNARLGGKILLLEPRRLAARLVAGRLASHLDESVGQRIGLRMRGETKVSGSTQLEVVTEGVLTRLLQSDPTLDGVALVIFDEFHERSLHADLGLALCLEVQRDLRDDLRLMLMSATLQSEQLNEHLTGIQYFQCAVRQHPVRSIWVGESSSELPQRITQTVMDAVDDHLGDVLVFLPGVAEIKRCSQLLLPRLSAGIALHILHSGVGAAAQSKATAPANPDHRRVILATSLAETSITIDGVRVVVDSGLERRGTVDSVTSSLRLETVTASQASATQRAGRAGRTAAGVCYRLWSELNHSRRPSHWEPEIRRAELAPLLLELGVWGAVNAENLPWLEAPPAAGLSRASTLLHKLGLWDDGQPTAQGRLASELPVHPRLGSMLLWAVFHRSTSLACRLAVAMEAHHHPDSREVDLELVLNESFSQALQQRASRLERLLVSIRGQRGIHRSTHTENPSAGVLMAQAFPDWIARRRPGQAGRFLLACGAGVVIDAQHPLAHCEWLVVAQLGGTTTQLRIFKALSLCVDELERFSPQQFDRVEHIDWDDSLQRVIAERRWMIGSIQVSAETIRDISDSQKQAAMLAGIRKMGLDCLPWTDQCREWQARVIRMHELTKQSDNDAWPSVDDDMLMTRLENWLLPWIGGINSMKALQRLDLQRALEAMLDYSQQKLLDQCFPVRYQVPSGSRIAVSYIQPGDPVLSVRLQEMLGCSENPSIARGLVRLKVELLSPAHRPVQVTTDLVNFWRTSYQDVKKEMAGRYPKHVWPDDPLMAQPTAYAKRRKPR